MSTVTKDQINSEMKSIHYEIQDFIKTLPGFENYSASLKLDWSNTRTASRGGLYKHGPGVNYAMTSLTNSILSGVFQEYSSFSSDTMIGSIKTTNWRLICMCLSCHEQSHAALSYLDKNNKEGHGNRWKDMYRVLRNKFVNPFLKKKFEVNHSANTIAVIGADKKEDQEFVDLKLNGPLNGIHPRHFNLEFTIGPKKERVCIVGWNNRARKYPVILDRLGTNKKYKASAFQVISWLKAAGVY